LQKLFGLRDVSTPFVLTAISFVIVADWTIPPSLLKEAPW